MSRDYAAEMFATIETFVPAGNYVAALIADDLFNKLEATDPDLLRGFLVEVHGRTTLTDLIARRSNSLRQVSRIMAPRKAFADAAQVFAETGDAGALVASFRVEYVVNSDNLRLTVADMTGTDHQFVAGGYESTAKNASMLAAFHRAVAKKVGDRRTADVFTEEQYDTMLRSITRTDPK
jgi:hypothetical protein